MSLAIRSLSEVCAAEVTGLDMTAQLGPEDRARLEDAFDCQKVLVFRR